MTDFKDKELMNEAKQVLGDNPSDAIDRLHEMKNTAKNLKELIKSTHDKNISALRNPTLKKEEEKACNTVLNEINKIMLFVATALSMSKDLGRPEEFVSTAYYFNVSKVSLDMIIGTYGEEAA